MLWDSVKSSYLLLMREAMPYDIVTQRKVTNCTTKTMVTLQYYNSSLTQSMHTSHSIENNFLHTSSDCLYTSYA
jgi:hypothetical protein